MSNDDHGKHLWNWHAATLLGITVKTLQRWEREGRYWFAHYAALHGCELLVLNQERLSPEQEMVQDLMTIVHCFSSRLDGLRNYRSLLRAALETNHAAGAPDRDSPHA